MAVLTYYKIPGSGFNFSRFLGFFWYQTTWLFSLCSSVQFLDQGKQSYRSIPLLRYLPHEARDSWTYDISRSLCNIILLLQQEQLIEHLLCPRPCHNCFIPVITDNLTTAFWGELFHYSCFAEQNTKAGVQNRVQDHTGSFLTQSPGSEALVGVSTGKSCAA